MKIKSTAPIFPLFLVTSLVMLLGCAAASASSTNETYTTSGTWTAPPGVYQVTVEVWGGGGGGGGQTKSSLNTAAGGGGGGAYARLNSYAVTPGNTYAYTVGAAGTAGTTSGTSGGAGGASYFVNTSTLNAAGGSGGAGSTGSDGAGGAGGAAGTTGDVKFKGGNGATGGTYGGGGGGSGGSVGAGGAGANTAPPNGAAAVTDGGPGGNGGNGSAGLVPASGPGGGGGGGDSTSSTAEAGGPGYPGQISFTYAIPTVVTFTSGGTWTPPAGVTNATVELWGGGGAGGGASSSSAEGSGGAGGQYAIKVVSVTPGTGYTIAIGSGGTGSTGAGTAGGDSTFATTTVVAKGGAGGAANNGSAGQGSTTGGVGDTVYAGGNGTNSPSNGNSGGGGGGAGSSGPGGNAAGTTAGTGTAVNGGNGGAGRTSSGTGNAGNNYGGGGGGAVRASSTSYSGGAGAPGYARITYIIPDIFTNGGSYTWTAPAGVTNVTVQTWGGGGQGGTRTTSYGGGGGGGGAYSSGTVTVVPGTTYNVVVGSGSSSGTTPGGDSYFYLATTTNVLAKGGGSVATNSATGASGGAAASGIGSTTYSGGAGANGVNSGSTYGGGGGSSAGTAANGNNGSGATGGSAPTGGGAGGNGFSTASTTGDGSPGSKPGGGGGGGKDFGSTGNGGSGADGQVIITYGLPATVTLGSLTQTYNGGSLAPTVTTVPADLSIVWGNAPQTNAGTYSVTATINDPIYAGSASGTFVINKTNLTVTAAANTKTYDGTTNAAATPTVTAGNVQAGDTANFIESYTNKNVGTGKILTPSGTVTDGNGGNNYNYTFVNSANGTINKTNLTVTAAANTKTYDGTTNASAVPTFTSGSVQSGDTANFIEVYTNKNVGSGKTLKPSGTVTDGNSGNNYNYTFVNSANGTINGTNLTVTAAANTKTYDGTASAAATPTITAGHIQTGDSAPAWTETYDTKNQGSGKTLTPAGVVNDGNSGLNYNYTYATVATGVINKTNLTVTAAANTKTYDGTTNAAAAPTVTAGNVQAGDTANFIESYTNKNVGTGKILTPSGTVTDGNSGNNYSYTFASTANGTITQASASVLVISSENPSGYKDSVFFTATNLPSDATGNAIFLTNGVTFSTNSLTSGSAASLSVTNLPRGTNTVTVQYAGDGNYLGSTNNLAGGQVVTNHPPTATTYNVSRTAGLNLLITISNLTNQWNDVDGDTVAMNWINLVTTNGVTVRTNSSLILYTNNLNVNDQITYVINDGQGGTNTGVINVTVNPFVTGQQTSTPLTVSGGSVTATFFGIPTYIYEVQRSTNLNAGIGWVNISTNTVGSGGTFSITDQFSDLGGHIPSSAYYRLEWHP